MRRNLVAGFNSDFAAPLFEKVIMPEICLPYVQPIDDIARPPHYGAGPKRQPASREIWFHGLPSLRHDQRNPIFLRFFQAVYKREFKVAMLDSAEKFGIFRNMAAVVRINVKG
jgi:hypothetical protein